MVFSQHSIRRARLCGEVFDDLPCWCLASQVSRYVLAVLVIAYELALYLRWVALKDTPGKKIPQWDKLPNPSQVDGKFNYSDPDYGKRYRDIFRVTHYQVRSLNLLQFPSRFNTDTLHSVLSTFFLSFFFTDYSLFLISLIIYFRHLVISRRPIIGRETTASTLPTSIQHSGMIVIDLSLVAYYLTFSNLSSSSLTIL